MTLCCNIFADVLSYGAKTRSVAFFLVSLPECLHALPSTLEILGANLRTVRYCMFAVKSNIDYGTPK